MQINYEILILLSIPILWHAISALFYIMTDYYRVTHKSWWRVRFDTGVYGEYMTYKALRSYEKDGARFLYNCYLPKGKDGTTEIDLIMLYKSGVFVFESKNYSGWIFGDDRRRTWTQTLPSGRSSHKEHFLNPIMQNKLHIKWLEEQIGAGLPIYSVIVFSNRCSFMDVSYFHQNTEVIHRKEVRRTVKKMMLNTTEELQPAEINRMYTRLYPFTQVSDEVKAKHIEDIWDPQNEEQKDDSNTISTAPNSTGTVETVVPDSIPQNTDNLICPRCGGKLVLRTAGRGANAGKQFYGCSNFPKCRYIK